MRIGLGFDVHRLKEGVPFFLGGIPVEHTKGAVGHSDADVLIHAICDAILGAAGLRDIGVQFPDDDPGYKGIDSKILLKKVVGLMRENGFEIENLDSTICLQVPKVNKHIPDMKMTLALTMHIEETNISIKATTTEKLGFVGNEDGVSAYAVVLLRDK